MKAPKFVQTKKADLKPGDNIIWPEESCIYGKKTVDWNSGFIDKGEDPETGKKGLVFYDIGGGEGCLCELPDIVWKIVCPKSWERKTDD